MKYFLNSILVISSCLLFIFSCAKDEQTDKVAPAVKETVEAVEPVQSEPADDPAKAKVIAKVGDQIITEDDVMGKLSLVPEQFRAQFETPEAKQKLLEQTVNSAVLMLEARRLGIDKQPDVAQKVNEIANNIIIQELTRQEIIEKIEVTEEEKEKYYSENMEAFFSPEKSDVSLILIAFDEEETEESKAEKKKKAEDVLARLHKGEDFAELAREVSDDAQTARRGGKVGYFSKGKQEMKHGSVFEDNVFSLEPGEISDVIEEDRGFYIIRVTDKRPEKQESFEDSKNRIKQILMQEKQQKAFEDYMQNLKEKFDVEIYEDRL